MHSEISPAPQTPSPSLESIIPKSVVIICTQQFCRFSLRFGTPGISRKSFCSLCTSNSSAFSRALARLDPLLKRHSFLCDSSDTHRICFPEVCRLRPTFLRLWQQLTSAPCLCAHLWHFACKPVLSCTPLALCVQLWCFAHNPRWKLSKFLLMPCTHSQDPLVNRVLGHTFVRDPLSRLPTSD